MLQLHYMHARKNYTTAETVCSIYRDSKGIIAIPIGGNGIAFAIESRISRILYIKPITLPVAGWITEKLVII